MAWMMPAPPPGLVDLLRRGGVPANGAPANTMQPDPQSMAVTPSGPDVLRSALTPQATPPAAAPAAPPTQQAPPPSDDPAISPTPKVSPVPAPPDMSNSPVTGLLKNMQDTQGRITAVPKPDPSQLRPKWYDRLAGAGVAFAAGWGNPERGYDIGSNVTNRRWNSAQTQYERTVSPLQSQLQSEREQLPAAEAAAKIPQTTWENQVKKHEEDRLTSTAQSNEEYKKSLNDIRTMYDQGRLDMAQKRLDETAERNKENNDRQKELLDLRQQMVDLKAGQKNDTKPPTAGQKAATENRKAQALQKAEQNYRKSISMLSPNDEKGKQDALDQLTQDKQEAQNAYENEINASGGTSSHVDITAAQGTPAAKPQAASSSVTPDLWKGKENKRLVMSDGSKWELQGGKPVQVSAPTKK